MIFILWTIAIAAYYSTGGLALALYLLLALAICWVVGSLLLHWSFVLILLPKQQFTNVRPKHVGPFYDPVGAQSCVT